MIERFLSFSLFENADTNSSRPFPSLHASHRPLTMPAPQEPYWPSQKLKVCVTGAGGFIASHLARRLKGEGHYVVAADWKKNEHMTEDMFCDEFHLVDCRVMDNCLKIVDGCDHVFNLAADMGGMGFIQSNHSVIMYNNTMISFNMLEAARIKDIKRFFYASSACVYPEYKQLDPENNGLKEADAWPAQPQVGGVFFYTYKKNGQKSLVAFSFSFLLFSTVYAIDCYCSPGCIWFGEARIRGAVQALQHRLST